TFGNLGFENIKNKPELDMCFVEVSPVVISVLREPFHEVRKSEPDSGWRLQNHCGVPAEVHNAFRGIVGQTERLKRSVNDADLPPEINQLALKEDGKDGGLAIVREEERASGN